MDNKVNIKIANSNQYGFQTANINDIVCYAQNSNNAFHIGIQNTSNYITFAQGINIHNTVQVDKDIRVMGQLLDANGHSYSVGGLADGAITSNFISDSNVYANHLADRIIQTKHIAPKTITGESISNNSITFDHLNSNILKAENISTGTFNQGSFTFSSNTSFNEGIICQKINNKFIKVHQQGNPYIIDVQNNDYDGRAINVINNTTVNGNSENHDCAMVNVYMPNLYQNKENKVRIGKDVTRRLEISYKPNNSNTDSFNDTATIQLLSSTGNSPHLMLSSNAIGINNTNPTATLDCKGNVILDGDLHLKGSMKFIGETMQFKDGIQFDFINSNLTITSTSNTSVYLPTPNCAFVVRNSNQDLIEINSNMTVNTNMLINNDVLAKCSITVQGPNDKSTINASCLGLLSMGNNYGVFSSTLSQSHSTSFNHYVANNGIEPVFQVKRDGFLFTKGAKSEGNVGINTDADTIHALKVDGSVHISNKYYGNGSEIQHINADNITSGILNFSLIDNLPASKITSATMLADRVSGGTMGVIDGNNILNVNAGNLRGVYSINTYYDTDTIYKTVVNKPQFEFKNDGKFVVHSTSTQFLSNVDLSSTTLTASNIYSDFFHGNGFNITNVNAENLVGTFGNDFRYAVNDWIKSSDEQDRLKFTSNTTHITGLSNVYIQTSNVVVDQLTNMTITNPSTIANVTSCFTGVNYASNQNLSDLEYELRGTISLRHYPSNSNNLNDNVRAITVSRNDNVTAFVSSSGIVYGESTYYTSDERVKTDIVDINDKDALNIVSRLNPKKYKKWSSFNHDVEQGDISKSESGFIAQDVYEKIPELRHLVDLPIDCDIDKNDWGTKKAHLNYSGLIAYLVAAIKEQQRQLDEIKHVVFN
jgi:hypothetical protein